MKTGHRLRRKGRQVVAAAVAAAAFSTAALAVPALSAAKSAGPSASNLSPRLVVLAKPAVRSASLAKQAADVGLAAHGPGSLLRSGADVLVNVRFDSGAASHLGTLRAAGGRVVHLSRRYQTVTALVPPAALHAVGDSPGVQSVTESLAPITASTPVSGSPTTSAAGCLGSVVSEGDIQLHAADARENFSIDGSGVKVGILSDSFNQDASAATSQANDVASGDLPGLGNPCGFTTPVQVVGSSYQPKSSDPAPTDEGRAMGQIVHDLAPGASLAFSTAFNGELTFADNIRALATAGAKVIVDDASYLDEPFFQDGPVAAAVNDVTANDGVSYFSAAGNNNLTDSSGNDIASWEAPQFRDANSCPVALTALLPYTTDCMNFRPGSGTDTTFGITVAAGATLGVDLQWAEPWNGVQTDIDAYLLDSNGNPIIVNKQPVASEDDNLASQEPFEFVQWTNTGSSPRTVQLAINKYSGAGDPRLKFALIENGGGVTETEYPTSSGGDVVGPTIFGHSGTSGAISAGAVPFNGGSAPELYSSHGPETLYYGPVNGSSAAAALPSPQVIHKPDLSASDCVATTFFADLVGGTWRFCGTSSAAPHAAAIAALELQADPTATVAQVRNAQTSTATPIGSFVPDEVGTGLVNANAAVANLVPPATVTVNGHPADRTSDNAPTFSFTSNAPVDHFGCLFDGGTEQPCSSPYTTPTALADGPHTFKVIARSAADAILGSASFSFTVDTTPPTVTIDPQPTSPTAENTPTFGFAGSEPASFSCAIDGAIPQPCTSPFTALSALADGPHVFEVFASDDVGNVGHASASFTVDTTGPTVTFTDHPADLTRDRTPTFGFAASEPASFSCAIDGAIPQPCTSPFTAPTALVDGHHTFEVFGTDMAGNAGNSSLAFTVDTTPPTVTIIAGPGRATRARTAVLRFSSEADASFECRHDAAPWRPCTSPRIFTVGAGRHRFRVRATDLAGNTGQAMAYRWRVKAPRRSRR